MVRNHAITLAFDVVSTGAASPNAIALLRRVLVGPQIAANINAPLFAAVNV